MMLDVPSPAIALVGRHNSGKTTLVEKLIRHLVNEGYDIGTVKHHSKPDFEIDYPGKDSYRHRQAGATETVIACSRKIARVKTIEAEVECSQIVRSMPGHDLIIVEGYRKSGLPTIELMRAGNEADHAVANALLEGARAGLDLECDFTQMSRGDAAHIRDVAQKMPASNTVAIVTDIPEAQEAARIYDIPAFGLENIAALATFLKENYVRPHISVVIQAGGESKRMGRSKATVPFDGKPLIVRLVGRLKPVADELIITTNEPENLGFLAEEFPGLEIVFKTDMVGRRGALPGLYTALEAASNPYVAVVACDMVFASAPLVVAEALDIVDKKADIVVPVNKHGFEPFHAMYKRETCLPIVKDAVSAGENRMQSIYDNDALRVIAFSQEQVLAVEPRGGCFINANTPEELARIEESYLGE